jgi:hypothetical protein
MPQGLHLQPGYTVDLAHLRHRVTLADDLTLGAVCESLERMAPDQRAALEAILGYPLAPWLDDCRRPVPPDDRTGNGLVEIRLRWRCWSSVAPPGAPPWPTWLRLDVEGIGAIWRGCRPGEPHYREGVEPRRDYAIEFTPLAILQPLPLRLDPMMAISVEGPAAVPETRSSLPALETTLLALLTALFDECSTYGSPEARDREWAEWYIRETTPRIWTVYGANFNHLSHAINSANLGKGLRVPSGVRDHRHHAL